MNLRLTSYIRLVVFALGLVGLHGCAGLTPEEKMAKRAELDEMGEQTIAILLRTQPEAKEFLEQSIGYFVVDMKVTKIPWFGAGSGLGVVVDKRTGRHSYVEVSRFEVGGGLGAQSFKIIVFLEDEKLLDRAISGAWHFDAGAEASAGDTSTEGTLAATTTGYHAFKIAEGGAIATVTVRVARAKPYLN